MGNVITLIVILGIFLLKAVISGKNKNAAEQERRNRGLTPPPLPKINRMPPKPLLTNTRSNNGKMPNVFDSLIGIQPDEEDEPSISHYMNSVSQNLFKAENEVEEGSEASPYSPAETGSHSVKPHRKTSINTAGKHGFHVITGNRAVIRQAIILNEALSRPRAFDL